MTDLTADDLKTNCADCAALCCVLLDFDEGEAFGHDKSACESCTFLTRDNRCGQHEQLDARGYAGCIWFDCAGAGPRVWRDLYKSVDWRETPNVLPSMAHSFAQMRRVHEQAGLLLTAQNALELSGDQTAQMADLMGRLCPENGWDIDTLAMFASDKMQADVSAFLATLAGQAARLINPRSKG